MKFDDLDDKMRVYETVQDRCVLPNMYINRWQRFYKTDPRNASIQRTF